MNYDSIRRGLAPIPVEALRRGLRHMTAEGSMVRAQGPFVNMYLNTY